MPYFSIIVPVYNVAPYLNEALDSVLSQTFADWECLCVDDGSKDTSPAILDDYARRDPRFKITHQPNAGVSAARNRALDQMHGTWLAFLDADDILHFDFLTQCRNLVIESDEVDLISHGSKVGEEVKFNNDDKCVAGVQRELDLRKKIPFSAFSSGVCWDKVFRSVVIGKLRFRSIARAEDALFSAEFILRSRKLIQTNICGYGYRLRSGSAMLSKETIQKIKDSFDAMSTTLRLLLRNYSRVEKKALRAHAVQSSEAIAHRLSSLKRSKERKEFKHYWLNELYKISKEETKLPIWFKLSFSIAGALQWDGVWKFLFCVPFKLKSFRNKIK